MAIVKKLISDEDKQKIEAELEDKYGIKGEDWDVLYVSIKGKEKAFALKAPARKYLNNYRKLKEAGKTPDYILHENMTVDCLITDVEGCSNLVDYRADLEDKPFLSDRLSGVAARLGMSGLDDLKKE